MGTYRIGIDVGARSVGIGAVTYDDDQRPRRIARAISVLHDGGGDRKRDASAAARSRRRYQRAATRTKHLDRLLDDLGYPRPGKTQKRHAAWRHRARAATGFIPNPPERAYAIAAAARHIAQHPGQRSPWITYSTLTARAATGFTTTHHSWVAQWATHDTDSVPTTRGLREHLATTLPEVETPTVGQVVAAALDYDPQTRIRSKGPSDKPTAPGLLDSRIRAEDSLTEWFRICDRQQVPQEHRDQIARAIFTRERPHIAAESVGTCPLTGHPRAPHGAVEFERYRATTAAANLRVRDSTQPRALTSHEFDRALALLYQHHEKGQIEWIDVEDHLGLPIGSIVAPTALDETGRPAVPTAPTCRTSGKISDYLTKQAKKKGPHRQEWQRLARWWDTDPDGPDRLDMAAALTDPTIPLDEADIDGLGTSPEVLDNLTDPDGGPNLTSRGRAAFSRDACAALTDYITAHRCDLTTAIKTVYGVDSWEPPQPSWDEKTGHPVIDEVTRIVRRQVTSIIAEMGTLPESVAIELARDATKAPDAYKDALGEQARRFNENRAAEASLREHLAAARHVPVADIDGTITPAQRIRWRKLTEQDSRCLYCGATITMPSSELDHIMPASKGGSNRDENKVAACTACNAAKDNRPFPSLLDTPYATQRGITLDAVTDRVRDTARNKYPARWQAKARGMYANRVTARLKATTYDQFDERSIAATGFAATHVRGVLTRYLTSEAARRGLPTPTVEVYSGRVVAAARKIGHINRAIEPRDAARFQEVVHKSRLDYRHHAVDALTLTALAPGIAQTLTIREGIRRVENERGITRGHPHCTWSDYEGDTWPQQQAFRGWMTRLRAIPDLIRDTLDTLPVITTRSAQPITKVGARHADTIHPFTSKTVGEAWTLADINRVADFPTGQALAARVGPQAPAVVGMTPHPDRRIERIAGGAGLPEDPTRTLTVNAHTLGPTDTVALYPGSGSWLPVRGGAAPLGSEGIPAGRLLAWRDTKGRIQFGLIRLYSPELDLLGWGPHTDPLTGPLPPDSQAMRTLHPSTAAAIATSTAIPIGVLRIPTEIRFAPGTTGVPVVDPYNEAARDHGWRSETAWIITGLMSPKQVYIRPRYLSREGLATSTPGETMPTAIHAPIWESKKVTLATLLRAPGLTIIDRDWVGRPVREWNPVTEATRLLP